MGIKLDEKDIRLIGYLQKNARLSVSWLAKATAISRPTVMGKMARLKEAGLLKLGAKTDFRVLDYKLAILYVRFEAFNEGSRFANLMRSCPRVLQILESTDKRRYMVLVYAEEASTLISFVDSLKKCVGKDFAWEMVRPIYGSDFTLNIFRDMQKKTPCDIDCSECSYYESGECVACPSSLDHCGKQIEV